MATIDKTFDEMQYWRIRALFGDLGKANEAIDQARQAAEKSANALKSAVESGAADIDMAKVAQIAWTDDTHSIVFTLRD